MITTQAEVRAAARADLEAFWAALHGGRPNDPKLSDAALRTECIMLVLQCKYLAPSQTHATDTGEGVRVALDQGIDMTKFKQGTLAQELAAKLPAAPKEPRAAQPQAASRFAKVRVAGKDAEVTAKVREASKRGAVLAAIRAAGRKGLDRDALQAQFDYPVNGYLSKLAATGHIEEAK